MNPEDKKYIINKLNNSITRDITSGLRSCGITKIKTPAMVPYLDLLEFHYGRFIKKLKDLRDCNKDYDIKNQFDQVYKKYIFLLNWFADFFTVFKRDKNDDLEYRNDLRNFDQVFCIFIWDKEVLEDVIKIMDYEDVEGIDNYEHNIIINKIFKDLLKTDAFYHKYHSSTSTKTFYED